MSPQPINQDFVEEQIERLQADFGEVEVDEGVVEVPPDEFPQYVENARDGYVGSAYGWVTRQPDQCCEPSESYDGGEATSERALLILPRGKSAWGIPGGGVEDGESFERAARREVREEAGVHSEITGLWHLEHLHWRSEDASDERVSHTLHVYFDAAYAGSSIDIQPAEVDGAAWFAEPPERLMEKTAMRSDSYF